MQKPRKGILSDQGMERCKPKLKEHMLSVTGGGRGYFVVNPLNSSRGTRTVHVQISVLGAVSLHFQPPS